MTLRLPPGRALAAFAAAVVLVPAVSLADPGKGNGNGYGNGNGHAGEPAAAVPSAAATPAGPADPAPAAAEAPPAAAVAAEPDRPGNGRGQAKGRRADVVAAVAQPAVVPAKDVPAPAAPQPAVAPEPVAPAASAAAPAVAPAPAPSAAPTAAPPAPTVTRSPRAPARGELRLVRRRAAARARAAPPARRAAAPFAAAVPALAGSPARPVAGMARPGRTDVPAAGSPRRPATARDPVIRTVTRVLALIPLGVWVALAALAILGLLLGLAAAVQTARSRRLERIRRALVADVGVLQSALLPALPGRIGGAAVTAAYRPADGLAAGGDFFDVFDLAGGRTALVVGDVAGHGRDVVPLTAAVRYSLRAYLEAGLPPRAVLHVANNALAGQLDGTQVTVAVAVLEPEGGRLTYACAGHWPPLLLGVPSPAVTVCSSPPLGAGLPTGRRQTTVTLPAGGAACFFTDGLLDVVAGDGERLGPDGLAAVFAELGPAPAADALLAALVARSTRQPDDMAACVVAPLAGAAAGAGARVEELEIDATGLAHGRLERFLRACGADAAQARAAAIAAWPVVRRAGTAVALIAPGADGEPHVTVRAPDAVSLRLPAEGAERTEQVA